MDFIKYKLRIKEFRKFTKQKHVLIINNLFKRYNA